MAAGDGFTCALVADGTVSCWGDSYYGQLAQGPTMLCNPGGPSEPCSPTAVSIAGLDGVTAISAGADDACALMHDGTVVCWGDLGAAGVARPTWPLTRIGGVQDATAIAAGGTFGCALVASGAVRCWGTNGDGDLGNGTVDFMDHPSSTPVAGLADVTAIAAGLGHVCALLSSGTVECWGRNSNGQLGNGDTATPQYANPTPVAKLGGVVGISAGDSHTCAVLSDGSVQCWGDNTYGELGQETFSTSPVANPVSVRGLGHATAVSAGNDYTCALIADGSVECWGIDDGGMLGVASNSTCGPSSRNGGGNLCALTPARAPKLSGVAALAAGAYHRCALLSTGRIECWGNNAYGALGNGTTTDSTTPLTTSF